MNRAFDLSRPLIGLMLFGSGLFTPVADAVPPKAAQEQVRSQSSSLAQLPVLEAQAPTIAQANTVDLSALQNHLAAQDWQAADAETRRILKPWVDPSTSLSSTPLASNIPPDVLREIDQLWLQASRGRFGFSVQRSIWQEAKAQHPNDPSAAADTFGKWVGWRRPVPDGNNFVAPDWFTEPELDYSLDAPVGHLPWPGPEWQTISNMLSAQSCGSCMIDAMDLQGALFNRYIPVLFDYVATVLNNPPVTTGESWQQAHLARSIDLRSLYPDNSCPVRTQASAISPDSKIIAISSYSYERACGGGSTNSTFALWNAERGNRIITLVRGQATEAFSAPNLNQEPETEGARIVGDVVNAVAFTPDSRLVVAGLSNSNIQIWTTDKGEAVRTLSGHRYAVRAIAISADGRTLASASSDQTIRIWNLQTGQLLRTIDQLHPADGIIHTLQISPNGQRVAVATANNTLQLLNTQNGNWERTFVIRATNLYPPLPIVFSPDGQIIATADIDNSVKLWNATTGARIITLRGHAETVQHLAFSPDSQRLASSDSKTARLWNLQTYQPIHALDLIQSAGHPIMPDNLSHVGFSPDGQILATSSLLLPLVQSEPIPAQGVALWDANTGQVITHIHNVAQFQFSPNGQYLMANGQAIQIWERK